MSGNPSTTAEGRAAEAEALTEKLNAAIADGCPADTPTVRHTFVKLGTPADTAGAGAGLTEKILSEPRGTALGEVGLPQWQCRR